MTPDPNPLRHQRPGIGDQGLGIRDWREPGLSEYVIHLMQGIIEEVIRWFGYGMLKLATFGFYRGGQPQDELAEGAVGLGIMIGSTYLFYVLLQQ